MKTTKEIMDNIEEPSKKELNNLDTGKKMKLEFQRANDMKKIFKSN